MGSHGNTVLDSGGPLSVQPNGAAALQRLAASSIQQHSRRQVSHDLDRAGKFRPSNALSRFYGATPSWRAATYLPRLSRAICGQPFLTCPWRSSLVDCISFFDFGPSEPRARSGTSVDQSDIPGQAGSNGPIVSGPGSRVAMLPVSPSRQAPLCSKDDCLNAASDLQTQRSSDLQILHDGVMQRFPVVSPRKAVCDFSVVHTAVDAGSTSPRVSSPYVDTR